MYLKYTHVDCGTTVFEVFSLVVIVFPLCFSVFLFRFRFFGVYGSYIVPRFGGVIIFEKICTEI